MPLLDPRGYKTYSIHAPIRTHFRKATCAEVDCPDYLHGWRVRLEILNEQQRVWARQTGRRFTELAVRPGETWLVFEAGQACFRATEHRARVEREELYVIRDGDTRGNPTGRVDRVSGQTWNDDFGEHQQRLADLQQKG
ncbi:hypothetical protein ABH931_006157 [Streptacidiphilus sp. MAP12-33]|uniref:hypothetical protein n=1 Tax=Streptacidiphilus sp. MAP12-33 TaxID=3156266 RepID=UPI003519BDD2